MTSADAVVLFAHGSRDPLWRGPIDAVARQMQGQQPGLKVCCAFLELTEPDLPQAVTQLVAQGAQRIRIVPMFLGVGRHAREDLPPLVEQLRAQFPEVALTLAPAVGEHPLVLAVLAEVAAGLHG
ncbi:MAG: Sirohydrochlorin ferrochelatase [Pseudomonadota bacterium]|jgi:sirohydrochlorin cobaltochelatase